MRQEYNRFAFIDALRGFAALYVLSYHNILVPDTKLTVPQAISPVLLKGGSGVTLFFIISAFTLYYTLQYHKDENKRTIKFYIRRFLRVAPLYYLWLFISVILKFGSSILIFKWQILANAFFAFNFFPDKQWGIVPAAWTLGVEMIFYLIFPIVFHFVTSLRKAIAFLCLSIAIALLHYEVIQYLSLHLDMSKYVVYLSFFHQLPVFAVGIVTYFICESLSKKNMLYGKQWGTVFLTTGIIGFLLVPYCFKSGPSNIFLYPMSVVYSLIFIALFLYPNKILVNKITVFYGMISYSVYLNHPRIIYYLDHVYQYIFSFIGNSLISLVVCIVVTLIPVTLLSYVTYRIIERPGILLGKILSKKIGMKSVSAVAVSLNENAYTS